MKLRHGVLLLVALGLAACVHSLAEDVTPPPDYVTPTSIPTPAIVYPGELPSPKQGGKLFTEKCASCHGENGLGNGPLASSLPVSVPAIGLREISSRSTPADWYMVISKGNADRGMPAFFDLPSQDLWNILAYVYSISTTADEIQIGQDIFAIECAQCHGYDGRANPLTDLADWKLMSQASGNGIFRTISEGKGTMPSFSDVLDENERWAVTAYLRSLGLNLVDPDTETTETAVPSITPQPTITEQGATLSSIDPLETDSPGKVTVTGSLEKASGFPVEDDLIATLYVYDPASQQVLESQSMAVAPDGSYLFTTSIFQEQVTYWVYVEYMGVTYFSDPAPFDGSSLLLDLPVRIYESTNDWQSLHFDLVHLAVQISSGIMQVNELFVFSNPGEKAVILETDGSSLPFIILPEGVAGAARLAPYSNSASFLPADGGLALEPLGDTQYGIVVSFDIPYERRYEFHQEIPMPVDSLTLYTPDGYKVRTDQLNDSGIQDLNGTVYHLYEAVEFTAGDLRFTISGTPEGAGSVSASRQSWLIIGIIILGAGFIGLGVFLFLRDRAMQAQEESEPPIEDVPLEEPAPSTTDTLVDAIIALDEQLKVGEIDSEVHTKRREELKERLKRLL